MNYPVWQLAFPGGLLIAFVAVVHVFVSHFAVGGGAFLVLTERRAYRNNDAGLLNYVRDHSKFFALLTLVFGAVTGVGIWFTIGLVSPEATSSLIHTFVWGWAIEWVFFLVEITAAIIYAYNWDRLDRRAHMTVGWIYFVAAWMSLLIINGIITYMLTPGRWLETHGFWDGFFNPTYWPSLLLRTTVCVLLAGAFGLITAVREPQEIRERVTRWAGAWIVAGAVLIPLFSWWYFSKFPSFSKAYFGGVMVPVQHAVRGGLASAALILLVALLFSIWKPRLMSTPAVAVTIILAFLLMASGEYLREFVRKPWAIQGYIYANDLRVSDLDAFIADGMGVRAKWLNASATSPNYGREVFIAQCSKCHGIDGYRSMRKRVNGWDAKFASNMLSHQEFLRGTMARFAGNEQDRKALGAYLASLNPPPERAITDANRSQQTGKKIFALRCGSCHTIDGKFRPLKPAFTGSSPEQIEGLLPVLDSMSPNMPPFTGTPEEGSALARYASEAANAGGAR